MNSRKTEYQDRNAHKKACSYCGTIPFRVDKKTFRCTVCHKSKPRAEMAWAGEQGLVVCYPCQNGMDYGTD